VPGTSRRSRHFAIRVIGEYKRFCYLAIRAGHSVTPSDEVDQGWHLHLLYTQSYWNDFRRGALGRPLHHNPTRGGPDESAKFHDHEKTLASYRRLFGSEPPPDIWPSVKARFADAKAHRRVDTASFWLVPKPRWRRRRHGTARRSPEEGEAAAWPWIASGGNHGRRGSGVR